MQKMTLVLSSVFLAFSFSSMTVADGHPEGMNWQPPPECDQAKAMFDAAGIDPMQLEMTASQLDESGMSDEEVDAELANTFFGGDQEAMDQLFDDAEATGASFETCMPPHDMMGPPPEHCMDNPDDPMCHGGPHDMGPPPEHCMDNPDDPMCHGGPNDMGPPPEHCMDNPDDPKCHGGPMNEEW